MRGLAVLGPGDWILRRDVTRTVALDFEGVSVRLGLLDAPEDEAADLGPREIRVRVRAFSLNYRDKRILLRAARTAPEGTYYVIGSEFAGDVLAVGREVSRVRAGDRVIGDNHYPDPPAPGAAPGIPTNHASREFLTLHEAKVHPIPDAISYEAAAGASIGLQTAEHMIARLALAESEPVLVASARSNTALFSIAALAGRRREGTWKGRILALTSSGRHADRIRSLGADEVLVFDARAGFLPQDPDFRRIAQAWGGFRAAIDPFFDLHLGHLVPALAHGGRYITCGLFDQFEDLVGRPPAPFLGANQREGMIHAMMSNISILGNCLGPSPALSRGLAASARGALEIPIDSVHEDVATFFVRTYDDPDRFGKVVFRYA